nr:hypothetical protein [Nonomuraea spiralis]
MLDLIDEKKSVMMHDAIGVLSRRRAYGCLIQVDLAGSCRLTHDRLGQCALADLPGAIDHHYTGVGEGFHRHGLGATREEREFICVLGAENTPHRHALMADLPHISWRICRICSG